MSTFLSRYWWVLVVRGIFAVLLGVFAFVWPLQTAAMLVLAFGFVALADGVFAIGSAFAGRQLTDAWWLQLLEGIFGIGVGTVTLANPAMTGVALVISIAVWAIGLGILQVIAAVKLRHELSNEWWLIIGGLLGVAFGILFLVYPAEGALAMLWLIGLFAIVWGVMLMVSGFDVRRLSKQPAAS